MTECPLFLSTVFKPLFSQEEQFYQVLGKAKEYELLSSEVSDLSGEKQQEWDFISKADSTFLLMKILMDYVISSQANVHTITLMQ